MKVERKECHKVKDNLTWENTDCVRNAKALIFNGEFKKLSFRLRGMSLNFKGIDEVKDLQVILTDILKFISNNHKVITTRDGKKFEIESKSRRQLRIAKMDGGEGI